MWVRVACGAQVMALGLCLTPCRGEALGEVLRGEVTVRGETLGEARGDWFGERVKPLCGAWLWPVWVLGCTW